MKNLPLLVLIALLGIRCGSSGDNNYISDAKTDLSIKPRDWKPVIKKHRYGAELAEGPTFDLTNTSKTISYHWIDVDVYFFDKDGNSLDTVLYQEARRLDPGKSLLVHYISTATVDTQATTAKAVIKAASSY